MSCAIWINNLAVLKDDFGGFGCSNDALMAKSMLQSLVKVGMKSVLCRCAVVQSLGVLCRSVTVFLPLPINGEDSRAGVWRPCSSGFPPSSTENQ